MGRTVARYNQRDPAEEAKKQAASQFQQQRQAQASAYAAAKFNEWQQNAAQREQSLQYRNQILQSQAEMSGLKTQRDLYNQGEIDRETKMYLAGIPVLREQLKQANIKPGSQEYRAEISAFAQHIPHAFATNPSIREDLKTLSHVDATAAEIADKIKTFSQGYQQGTGQAPTKVHVGANGEITGEATMGIPEKIADRYSRLQGAIELHQDLAARQLKDDMAHNRKDMSYADQPKLSAARMDASILEKAYPTLQSLGSNQVNQGTSQITPTPSPTPDQQPQASQTPVQSATPAPVNQIPSITSQDEYNSLPAGSQFNFNGRIGMKPQEPADTGQ